MFVAFSDNLNFTNPISVLGTESHATRSWMRQNMLQM